MNYVSAASDIFARKEKGILIDAADGIELKEYTAAIEKIIHKSDIRFTSRIFSNRIFLLSSSIKIVKFMTEKHSTVEISR